MNSHETLMKTFMKRAITQGHIAHSSIHKKYPEQLNLERANCWPPVDEERIGGDCSWIQSFFLA